MDTNSLERIPNPDVSVSLFLLHTVALVKCVQFGVLFPRCVYAHYQGGSFLGMSLYLILLCPLKSQSQVVRPFKAVLLSLEWSEQCEGMQHERFWLLQGLCNGSQGER